MLETEKAYLAGIIDGEGGISLDRDKRRGTITLHIRVAMTAPQAIEFMASTLVLPISTWSPKNPTHKLNYVARLTGKRAQRVLAELLPFLRVKREHAKLALAFPISSDHRGKKLNPAIAETQAIMRDKMMELNRRGL